MSEDNQPLEAVKRRSIENQQRIVALERDVPQIKKDVNYIRNVLLGRLPTWATLGFAVLTGLVGSLLGFLARMLTG